MFFIISQMKCNYEFEGLFYIKVKFSLSGVQYKTISNSMERCFLLFKFDVFSIQPSGFPLLYWCDNRASGFRFWVLPPVVRRGEPVCPGREAGRRASGAGPGMAHRRVPWDKRVNRGNPTQEGEQVGEKTFGDFGSFQSHSPSRAAVAKPRRGQRPRVLHGEAMLIRRVTPHPNPLPQGKRGLLPRTITLR